MFVIKTKTTLKSKRSRIHFYAIQLRESRESALATPDPRSPRRLSWDFEFTYEQITFIESLSRKIR